jgi:hypothetical protein
MRKALFLFVALVSVARAAWSQGDPVGPEFRVNTYTTLTQNYPSVSSDTAGNFVVVWNSSGQDGSDRGVFGQRYASSGAPLGSEFRVNTYTTYAQFGDGLAVASDSSGNFVVVWNSVSQDGSGGGVFGQRYASSGAPLGPEFRVSTYTVGNQSYPSVATSLGNFVVVWQSAGGQDGSSTGVFGQRYASSGVPLGPEFLVNTYTTNFQIAASVASDTSGNFVVVWVSELQDGSIRGVFGQRYASTGAAAGPEFRVNSYTTDAQHFPQVAADSSGNFVVAWQSYGQDGSYTGVFGQRYSSSGTSLGPEFRVNTYTTSYQFAPSIATDSAGNFVVVWESSTQDGSSRGVFGQRYASSGAPLGPEFRVNTYTPNGQDRPSVAADSSGDFIVTWDSELQDGSTTGVFGQRYNQIVPVELMHLSIE